jgi:Tol biopolymer transport system component
LSWNAPVPLGPEINTESFDQQPSISADGKTLFFSSDRPGGSGAFDLYMASRRIGH